MAKAKLNKRELKILETYSKSFPKYHVYNQNGLLYTQVIKRVDKYGKPVLSAVLPILSDPYKFLYDAIIKAELENFTQVLKEASDKYMLKYHAAIIFYKALVEVSKLKTPENAQ